jgi:hypothetical protein
LITLKITTVDVARKTRPNFTKSDPADGKQQTISLFAFWMVTEKVDHGSTQT